MVRIPLLLAALLAGCTTDTEPVLPAAIRSSLTFYASFDDAHAADYAAGDAALYAAPTPRALGEARQASGTPDLVQRVEGGRAGNALRFSTDWDPVVFFRAEDNVAYTPGDWSGTFSLWLRVDPENGLAPGYSDPFLVTDKNWDDASMYIDFTEEDVPRRFRFAAFADKAVWNPEGIGWDAVPPEERPMIDLASAPFSAEGWTHVALVFERFNTGAANGRMTGYINGQQMGVLEGRTQTITWDTGRALMILGRHYTGMIDEVAVFDRALGPDEVRALYDAPGDALLTE